MPLEAASAALFPYEGDVAGFAVLEPLACGTPVVAAAGPYLRSAHDHRRAVCFVDLDDAGQAGTRLARTIQARTQIAALADRDELLRRHAWQTRVTAHDELIRNSVADRRRAPLQ